MSELLDFGSLGKWQYETLLSQCTHAKCGKGYYDGDFEELYIRVDLYYGDIRHDDRKANPSTLDINNLWLLPPRHLLNSVKAKKRKFRIVNLLMIFGDFEIRYRGEDKLSDLLKMSKFLQTEVNKRLKEGDKLTSDILKPMAYLQHDEKLARR